MPIRTSSTPPSSPLDHFRDHGDHRLCPLERKAGLPDVLRVEKCLKHFRFVQVFEKEMFLFDGGIEISFGSSLFCIHFFELGVAEVHVLEANPAAIDLFEGRDDLAKGGLFPRKAQGGNG